VRWNTVRYPVEVIILLRTGNSLKGQPREMDYPVEVIILLRTNNSLKGQSREKE
jgi:hypothetical protein